MNFKIQESNKVTLADISIGNKGSYGISASAVEYSNELYTYLRITDINEDGTLNREGLKSVDDINAEKYLLKPNDIVFARTGNSTGKSYFYEGNEGQLVYAGFLIKFSLDTKKVNPKYIKYYTLSNEYKNWISSFLTGSTRGNINAKTYGDMILNLPTRKQQDYLVNILSKLDKKIEINNKINHNLEKIAENIYKYRFEKCTIYLQNGFERSEIGIVPLDWSIGVLSDLVDIKYGKDHKKLKDGNIPVYGSGGIMRYVNEKLYDSESVLIPRKGSLGNVIYVNNAFWSVDTMFYTVMKEKNLAKYIYFFVKSIDLIGMNSGSAVPSMTTQILNNIRVKIPRKEELERFEKDVNSIFKQIDMNKKQNEILTKLRDILLPKLMNGEIDLSNISLE